MLYGAGQGGVVAFAVVCGGFQWVMEGQFWKGGMLIFSSICNN